MAFSNRPDCSTSRRMSDDLSARFPDKFVPEGRLFEDVHRGDRIFIGTGCGEPQHLVQALIRYVSSHPKQLVDAEVIQVWTLGLAPYTEEKFARNFRHNSFFISQNSRSAVNEGLADYTPVFLSKVPELMRRGLVEIDVALVQTSLPDEHGWMSLGVSVDIVKAAVEVAGFVVAQVNPRMPRVHGNAFIHADEVRYMVHHEEPLLEFPSEPEDDVVQRIGRYVARLVEDGDTIQVGYGTIPNAIMSNLTEKRNLGVHSELIGDGLVDLIRRGVIDNSNKPIHRGKSVGSFCMGCPQTYAFLHDNPAFAFHPIDYTNDPLVIAQHPTMTAINSALEIDLTGQATAESLGGVFYSGIGGQADFMRGAVLAPRGKSILAIPSTAHNGSISRIVPFLSPGAGASLIRGDVHYVVTEYGIAYLHGKNIRERAMELIGLAHPKFRPQLVEEAKACNLIYADQAFVAGKAGEYPEELETYRTTRDGLEILLRPVKISDEPLLKDFFYSLSDDSMFKRFISTRTDMPHERLQEFVVIDYTKEMLILAILRSPDGQKEEIVGIGQYAIGGPDHTAEVAFVTRDDYQRRGIGNVLLQMLTRLARRQGLLGFTAEVLMRNKPMMRMFEKAGFDITREGHFDDGAWELTMKFREESGSQQPDQR